MKGSKGSKGSTLDSTRPQTQDTEVAMRLARGGQAHSPRISLLIYHRKGIEAVTLPDGQRVVVGRDPSADVHIEDDSLSRAHAHFEVLEGEVFVEDLDSTNGTKLNGERIRRSRIGIGDEATMGSVTASVHVLQPIDSLRYGLLSHDRFMTALEEEVVRAHTFGRNAALLMLGPADSALGPLGRYAEPLRSALRPVDRIALYSPVNVEILLPEADLKQAEQSAVNLAEAVAGAGDAERGAGFLCGIAVFPDAGTSADELLARCRTALMQAGPDDPVQVATSQRSGREPAGESAAGAGGEGAVVRSAEMREVFETVERLANSLIPVLLVGETGTGKEVVARAIHQSGPRADKPMACINCGAIPATLTESALFGHERGAFTGAVQQSKGLFGEADGGTVLLDEVGELSPSAQAALLRVLETKQMARVGSNKEIPVDVRVVAATHRDLETMCREGQFREDLYYRLNAMTLKVPPLRERPEEIAPLAERFVQLANEANGCSVKGIEGDALGILHEYPWPGNVRELRNAIERAVVITRGDRITADDLPLRVRSAAGTGAVSSSDAELHEELTEDFVDGLDYKARLAKYEARLIVDALRSADWNRTEAARLLKMPVRTLSHKIRQLGIKKLGYGVEEEPE